MATYASYRKALIIRYLKEQLAGFVGGFDPAAPTVILLPGGMGSQLMRTDAPFPAPQNAFTETIWIDTGIVFAHDGLKLEIVGDGNDVGNFVVAADGGISTFIMSPYDEMSAFAAGQGWNYFAFGYDWRRPVTESTELFRFFVGEFRAAIQAKFGKDPLPATTFVCHSMGGLVATLALRDAAFAVLPFKAILTVATPFYGTATHQQRYYIGEKMLNALYGTDVVAMQAGGFPGPYSLMYLPKAVFETSGVALGLTRYPIMDKATKQPADPYSAGVASRWPSYVRADYIKQNKKIFEAIAAPLPTGVKPRFFNVRAVNDKTTAVELLWEDIDGANHSPTSEHNPLTSKRGAGDGTVPHWSAIHADCAASNRRDLAEASDHGLLFEHPEVHAAVKAIVTKGKLPKKLTFAPPPGAKVASAGRATDVLEKMQAKGRATEAGWSLVSPAIRRALTKGLMR